jgi:hypothetical protein
MKLQWTHELPDTEGWYFMRVMRPGKPLRVVNIHRIPAKPRRAGSGCLCVSATKSEDGFLLNELSTENRMWAGPIPEPIMPEDKQC